MIRIICCVFAMIGTVVGIIEGHYDAALWALSSMMWCLNTKYCTKYDSSD
jgi:hypothetical protein